MSDTQAYWPGRDVSAQLGHYRMQPGYFYPGRLENTTNENTATVENTTNVGVDVGVTTINVPPAPVYRWPQSSLTADRMLEIQAQARAQARPLPDYVARPLSLGPPVQVAIAAPAPHVEQPALSGAAVFLPGFVAALAIMGALKLIKLLRLRPGWAAHQTAR